MTFDQHHGLEIYDECIKRIWGLSGDSQATTRQTIMQLLTGQRLPKAKCGVHALESAVETLRPKPMTFQQILDRDVPEIVAFSRGLAAQGIMGAILIYYRHEKICGVFEGEEIEAADGWTSAGVSIPCNIPWDQWNRYLAQRLGNVPIFAV